MLEQMLDKLLSHLNSEENEMALELKAELHKADKRLDLLDALEAAGVDNWHGFEHAQDMLEE